jgi:hypothetical protein
MGHLWLADAQGGRALHAGCSATAHGARRDGVTSIRGKNSQYSTSLKQVLLMSKCLRPAAACECACRAAVTEAWAKADGVAWLIFKFR